MPNCTTCFEIILSDCIDTIEFKLGLEAETEYVFKIKDKFQNTFNYTLTTDVDGNAVLTLTAAEKAMFTPYSGFFYLTVWLDNVQVDLWLCDAIQTCVQFSFQHDESLGNIIECTSTDPPQPEGVPNDGDIAVWSSSLGKWVFQAPCDVIEDCPTAGGGVWGAITGTLSNQTDLQNALNGKVNTEVGKGLSANDLTNLLKAAYDSAVTWIATNGANLLNHLTNTSNPHNTTAAQVGAPSGSGTSTGTNTGNETASTLGATINGAAAATPNDTDLVATVESSVVKKITWTNVKAFLKTYFDGLYNRKNIDLYLTLGDQINSVNTPATIVGLSFNIEANKRYSIHGRIAIGCNNTGGVQITFIAPGASTGVRAETGLTTAVTAFVTARGSFGVLSNAYNTQNRTQNPIDIYVEVNSDATGGTCHFQFQPAVNTQTATIHQLNTHLIVTELP